MRFRITGPRAITLGAIVAITGLSIPGTLMAAPASPPTSLAATAFTPVVVPPAAAPAGSEPRFAPGVPASDLLDRAIANTEPPPAIPPQVPVRVALTQPRAQVEVIKPKPKPAPKPKAVAKASTTRIATSSSARTRVVQIALAQLHDRYVSGGVGPDTFDCSGLVRYAYDHAGVGSKLGGGHSASAMYAWGRSNGLTSRSNGRPGDVVVYGNGSHVGIYLGNGKIISALNPTQGIRITGLYALGSGFTAFIHTRI